MANTDAALSDAQRHVLSTIKRRGETTADNLAAALDISSSAVRQHLGALRTGGYVEARPQRGQAGRPVDIYHATEATEALFAAPDADLSTEILSYVEDEDPELVRRVFERRRQRLAEAAADQRATDSSSLGDQVRFAAALLDARGYLAEAEEVGPGHFRINLGNCAIWKLATRFDEACESELELMQSLVPGATISRTTHKVAGSPRCGYDIHT